MDMLLLIHQLALTASTPLKLLHLKVKSNIN